jgi:CheY-like chemotaxis protein
LPDVDCAVDGADALAHLAHHKYDLVLMDLQMPGMDGVEATLAIRGTASPVLPANRDVPIVAVTALHLAQERDRCLAAGFSRVCTKPLADDTLRSVVMDLLGGAPAARR